MKRSFSLLEVCISFVLAAILITVLFSSHRQLAGIGSKVEKMHNALDWQWVFQTRISQIFETLDDEALFYTKEGKLHFSFNNGLCPDPEDSGKKKGSLSLNPKDKTLLLEIGDQKTLVLKTQASYLSFSFYDPKRAKWIKSWKGNPLPSMVKITVDNQTFSFLLPLKIHEVLYR